MQPKLFIQTRLPWELMSWCKYSSYLLFPVIYTYLSKKGAVAILDDELRQNIFCKDLGETAQQWCS